MPLHGRAPNRAPKLTKSTKPNTGGGVSGCLGGLVTPAGRRGEPAAPMFCVDALTTKRALLEVEARGLTGAQRVADLES